MNKCMSLLHFKRPIEERNMNQRSDLGRGYLTARKATLTSSLVKQNHIYKIVFGKIFVQNEIENRDEMFHFWKVLRCFQLLLSVLSV